MMSSTSYVYCFSNKKKYYKLICQLSSVYCNNHFINILEKCNISDLKLTASHCFRCLFQCKICRIVKISGCLFSYLCFSVVIFHQMCSRSFGYCMCVCVKCYFGALILLGDIILNDLSIRMTLPSLNIVGSIILS